MGKNRKTKAECRADYYTGILAASQTDGAKALTAAYNWFLKEVSVVAETDPQRAETIRWEYARQIARLASRVSKGRFERRSGISSDELRQLLNPWAEQARRGVIPGEL